MDVGGDVTQIVANGSKTCALLTTGAIRCWGNGMMGQLGYGNTEDVGDNETPASVGDINLGGTVSSLSAGGIHTCALLTTGKVRCWGYNKYGQLGYGHGNKIGDNESPADAGDIDVGGTVIQVSAGSVHTCALLDTEQVRCWGEGDYGRLGYGNTSDIGRFNLPSSKGDVNVGENVKQISAGAFHSCALLTTGGIRCWGRADEGQLGHGNTTYIGDTESPASQGDIELGLSKKVRIFLYAARDALYKYVAMI